jgi:hypothetical protein
MNTKWAHRGQSEDGYWYHKFDTLLEAQMDLIKYVGKYNHNTQKCEGNPTTYKIDHRYYDDFGGVHTLMMVPDVSEEVLKRLVEEVYNVSKCRQLFLIKLNF